MNNKAIALLSGGLDSFLSLHLAVKKMQVELALTFNYGQEAYEEEKEAASEITKLYNIEHKIINLPFLAELTDGNDIWVPNRNGLFLNTAGCFADKLGFEYIIFGANKEEGVDFPDNSVEFLATADNFLNFSTSNKAKIYAPLKDLDKAQIVELGIKNSLKFELLKSCYSSKEKTGKKHCGKCPSCILLKNALEKNNSKDLLKLLF